MTIVQSPKWESALRNTAIVIETGAQTTPLRKLIQKMPKVAEKVFNLCTVQTEVKVEGQEMTENVVYFNYEFLEDFRDPPRKLFSRR